MALLIHDDAFFDRLPPLVSKGEDRSTVLKEIIDRLTTRTPPPAAPPIIEGKAFVDENTGEPIDLAEILGELDTRGIIPDEAKDRPITITLCDIPKCSVIIISFAAPLHVTKSRFGPDSDFVHCTFGDRVSFSRVQFGARTKFMYSNFQREADFSISRFADSADFTDCSFADTTTFAQTAFGHNANFGGCRFGHRASFCAARFGDDAKLCRAVPIGKTVFGENADFSLAAFGDRADWTRVSLGDNATLTEARFGKDARFDGAHLPNAELLRLEGFAPSNTYVRGARFDARPKDPWSVLRRTYTGPSLVFILVLSMLFFVPFGLRMAAYVAAGHVQTEVIVAVDSLPEDDAATSTIDQFAARETAGIVRDREHLLPGRNSTQWYDLEVWEVVLAVDRGWRVALPAALVLLYNVGRFLITWFVAPMRDAEERSWFTPKHKMESWTTYRNLRTFQRRLTRKRLMIKRKDIFNAKSLFFLPTDLWAWCAEATTETYAWLHFAHRVLRWFFWIGIVSFVVNLFNWIFSPVWLPVP